MIYILGFFFFCIILISYFGIASHFNIVDKPNERSSHNYITIRGGGIIYFIAVLIYFLTRHFAYPYFFYGFLLISYISFLDDILVLSNRVRIAAHIIATLLLLYQMNFFFGHWYWLIITGIFTIGLINIYNFMDGINGITGGYSLVTMLVLIYLNYKFRFIDDQLIIIVILADFAFLIFNFRKRAKCFAGDVGSVGMAFILSFFILTLILYSHNIIYIMLLAVYGVDGFMTIFNRLVKGENVFKAHRSHLYQFLVNELKLGHLQVALIYIGVQLLIDVVILIVSKANLYLQVYTTIALLGILVISYIFSIYFILKKLRGT